MCASVLSSLSIHKIPGFGSVAGEVHSAILQSLGCMGLITNGAVRDLPGLEKMGFGVLARAVSPSHAYAHVVDHGLPVEILGPRIHLILADRHEMV